ncbi:MAG TPA: YciI family protein [Acidimicrobiales bacterium]|jgi:hypothetical protein
MQYLALLGSDESQVRPGTPEADARRDGHMRFGELAAGSIRGGAALQEAHTAATIRPGDGGPLVTDGPYTEVTEAIGGFYVLETETLDDAIELAKEIPTATAGFVTLRPLAGWWPYDHTQTGQRFLAMAYGKETPTDQPGTPEWEAAGAAHMAFVAGLGDAVLAGGALHPGTMATTVQVRDGDVVVTDGTVGEAAELAAPLYMFQAADRDAAVELAKGIPNEPGHAIEVRPVWEIG